jgi:D-arabinose 1-dehydrogenase-like Zn-dependent alcohol dehydrogenase
MGYDVIAIDTGADKLRLCKELGANHIVNFMTAVRSRSRLNPIRLPADLSCLGLSTRMSLTRS